MSDCSRCKIGGNTRCDNKGYYKISENPDFNYWGWASTCQVNSFGLALTPYANQAELAGVPYGYCGKKLTNTQQCSSIGLPECPGSTERIYVKSRKDTEYSKERLINCCLDNYEDKYLERGYCHPEWCKNNMKVAGTTCNNEVRKALMGLRGKTDQQTAFAFGACDGDTAFPSECNTYLLNEICKDNGQFNKTDKFCIKKAQSMRGDKDWDGKMLSYCSQSDKPMTAECLNYYKNGPILSNQQSWDEMYFNNCKSDSQITTGQCQELANHKNNQSKASMWDPAMIAYCNKESNKDKAICACIKDADATNAITSQPLCFNVQCQNEGYRTEALKNKPLDCANICQGIVKGETEVGNVNIEQVKISCKQDYNVDITDSSTPPDSTPPDSTPPDSTPPDSTPPDSTPPDSEGPNWPLILGLAGGGGFVLLIIIGIIISLMSR